MVLLIIVVILASIISIGGGSSAEVEMNGDNESSSVVQSSGIHMVEVNGVDLGSKDGNSGWSWLEFVVIVLGVIILLNFSHIAHYFLCTRAMVNKKVVRNVELEMNRLTALPTVPPMAEGEVIVPGLNQA